MDAQIDVAIIGAGKVGTALARSFQRGGARVTLGVRTPGPVQAKFEPLGICVGTPADILGSAEVVVLALPGKAVVDFAESNAEALSGKIVIDCSNPVGRDEGGLFWDPPAAGSLGEAVAAAAPKAHVLKAFNAFGSEFHGAPSLAGSPVEVLMAGDDDGAKERVAELAMFAGFSPVDAGPMRNARLLENMALLWIHLAMFGGQGRDFAFAMQRAEPA